MGEAERTVWDDLKAAANIALHGIDFADLDEVFDGRFALIVEDRRWDYGEKRFNMLVAHGGLVLNVTFTVRPPRYRIISARLAGRKERRIFRARQQDS
ncbi:BrnT family toxin [Methylobacterium sp. Leaf89]|uniref:BrnT family toxin n=1 Tax=Methylobacterium sp. Leaf89 TaxID=1736245 RepID=UPI0006FCF33B|nr:BrnT family toxin [Methylobacterium sp. Leaf89]KQO72286.1 toxin-antitoxin toxin component [Methylobacterium sp. Leaf89]